MKIILTGSTGFVGAEILKQCIAHTFISHVYVLTRRPLDDQFSHKKVTQLLVEDFESYPADLLERLREEGVEACIWALGGKTNQFKSVDEARKVNVNFPAQAAEMFAKHIAAHMVPYEGYPDKQPRAGVKRFPFRFVYISGSGAEQDQFRKLWFFNEDRKIKGAAERALFEAAAGSEVVSGYKTFEVISLRPGGVLSGKSEDMGTVITEAIIPSIAVDRLAKTAIRTAFEGGKDGKTIMENKDCLGDDWAMVNSLN